MGTSAAGKGKAPEANLIIVRALTGRRYHRLEVCCCAL